MAPVLRKRKTRAASAGRKRSKGPARHRNGHRVKVVRSRATRARKPQRPLPPPDAVSERVFISSLERSLRDNRTLWEALAKK